MSATIFTTVLLVALHLKAARSARAAAARRVRILLVLDLVFGAVGLAVGGTNGAAVAFLPIAPTLATTWVARRIVRARLRGDVDGVLQLLRLARFTRFGGVAPTSLLVAELWALEVDGRSTEGEAVLARAAALGECPPGVRLERSWRMRDTASARVLTSEILDDARAAIDDRANALESLAMLDASAAAAWCQANGSARPNSFVVQSMALTVLACNGRREAVDRLLAVHALRDIDRLYFRAVTETALGDRGGSFGTRLRADPSPEARFFAERLARFAPPTSPLPADTGAFLDTLEQRVVRAAQFRGRDDGTWRPTVMPAVVALLTAVYLWQLHFGPTSDVDNMYRAGAYIRNVPGAQHEWWRAIAAAYLHQSVGHLGLNAVSAWVFGRFVERRLGTVRTLIVWIVSGPLSIASYGALTSKAIVVVGASGAVSALIGAFAVDAVRYWRADRGPMAAFLLRIAILTIALQFVVDAFSASVAGGAHVMGMLFGVVLRVGFDAFGGSETRPQDQRSHQTAAS